MIERFPTTKNNKKTEIERLRGDISLLTEAEAEHELEALLADPGSAFLNEIKMHRDYMDNATANQALAYAWEKINTRLERTFQFEHINSLDGMVPERVNYRGVNNSLEAVLRGAREIGRGGDAFVVINKNEIRNLPPEICYKFALTEETPRGRNETFAEMKMQDAFYKVAKSKNLDLGVPVPFYAVEVGGKKVIAMEKLNAASIDDILGGKGILPLWLDIEEFCESLEKSLAVFHEEGLYHRDMHFGNIMISQSAFREQAEKVGYIIDFGLSGRATEGIEPYKKEVAGNTFTYTDDYAIVEGVRTQLTNLRGRRSL